MLFKWKKKWESPHSKPSYKAGGTHGQTLNSGTGWKSPSLRIKGHEARGDRVPNPEL